MLFDLSARVSLVLIAVLRYSLGGCVYRLRAEAPGFQPILIKSPSGYPLPQGSHRRLGKIDEVDPHVALWSAGELLFHNAVRFRVIRVDPIRIDQLCVPAGTL